MLTLDSVRKKYGAIVAVDGLSLEVRRGEIFGLLGPNGAGKSTLVHLAVGLLAPDEGRVRIGGLGNPLEPAVRARMASRRRRCTIQNFCCSTNRRPESIPSRAIRSSRTSRP